MSEELSWKLKEKVVAIIEQNLDKNSRVKHNIFLKVLKSRSGRKRQCDVVITQGKKPRQTISIVEVQKRDSKPEINEFNGWVVKKEEVGAQHLICVSEKGFPKSIIERAEELGPSVRLLTLEQLENDNWPIPSNFFFHEIDHVVYENLIGMEYVPIHIIRIDKTKQKYRPNPSPFEKIFRTKDGRLISVNDLMDFHFFNSRENLTSLPDKKGMEVTVHFKWEGDEGLEFVSDFNGWVKMKELKVYFKLSKRKEKIKWHTSEYKQLDFGKLMWVLTGTFKVNGKTNNMIIPLSKTDPGKYALGKPIILNDLDTFVSVGKSNFKVDKFEL